MKKLFFVLLTFLALHTGFYTTTHAQQRLGYVDTEYVLSQMPSYQQAQQNLDRMVENWKRDVEGRYQEIEEMYQRFQAERVLLSDTERNRREQEIVDKERAAKEFQKQKFNPGGELFQKRQELVRPVQDEVYGAIEVVAGKKNIDFVLDRSSGAAMLYANPKFDLTNDVLRELGVSGK